MRMIDRISSSRLFSALLGAAASSWYQLLLAHPTKAENDRLEEILAIIRMGPQQHMLAARLSYGQKQ